MRQHFPCALASAAMYAFFLLTLAPRPATAIDVAALAWSFEGTETPDIDFQMGPAPITATATQMSANGQADATATLNGTTSSLGVAVAANSGFILQTAAAAFTESFTFTQAGDVDFTFDIDGTVSGSKTDMVTLTLGASVDISATDDLTMLPIFIDSQMVSSGMTSLSVGPIPFEADVSKDVSFVLVATGSLLDTGDYDADFLNTATLTAVSSPYLASTGSGNTYGTAVAQIPEPSALVLTAIGLLILGWIPRRRRRLR
ncbi:MAG: PEP-CTERM sorting domain-containing protein [Planctomycetales bacterium]|nr:PEP-CTERM sorting domain-containing protein [Planctomycetales bacterium]